MRCLPTCSSTHSSTRHRPARRSPSSDSPRPSEEMVRALSRASITLLSRAKLTASLVHASTPSTSGWTPSSGLSVPETHPHHHLQAGWVLLNIAVAALLRIAASCFMLLRCMNRASLGLLLNGYRQRRRDSTLYDLSMCNVVCKSLNKYRNRIILCVWTYPSPRTRNVVGGATTWQLRTTSLGSLSEPDHLHLRLDSTIERMFPEISVRAAGGPLHALTG